MSTSATESTPMSAVVRDLHDGGCAAWQLPFDATSAAVARSYFRTVAAALALPDGLIDDGSVAVSELATNAHQHAGHGGSYDPIAPPELWIYPRIQPAQLVVTVFDTRRDRLPEVRPADPLDEHGKGLGIVAALAAETGTHPSRSRIGAWSVPGKAAWFALALPRPWPAAQPAPTPVQAAKHLQTLLTARGIDRLIRADRPGLSLISVRRDLNVWAEPRGFWLRGIDGAPIRRPLTDLQDVTELVIHHHERHASP